MSIRLDTPDVEEDLISIEPDGGMFKVSMWEEDGTEHVILKDVSFRQAEVAKRSILDVLESYRDRS